MWRTLCFSVFRRSWLLALWLVAASWAWASETPGWQLPLSGLNPSFVALERTWAKKAEFNIDWPKGAQLLAPQQGTLVHVGNTGTLGSHPQGWIIQHNDRVFSVLSTSMSLGFFDTQVSPGQDLRTGQVLARQSAQFPVRASLSLQWKVLRTESALPAGGIFSITQLQGATEMGVSALLGMGIVEFDVDNPLLAADFDIDLDRQRIAGRDTVTKRFLLREGRYPLAVVWGGLFKRTSPNMSIHIGGEGLLVHTVRRNRDGLWDANAYEYFLPDERRDQLLQAAGREESPASESVLASPTPLTAAGSVANVPSAPSATINAQAIAEAAASAEREAHAQQALLAQQAQLARAEQLRAEQARQQAEQVRQAQQQAQRVQAEREQELAAAVEAERQKRQDIEQRLAAAEARERERERLAAQALEQAQSQSTTKVYASRKALVIGNDLYTDVPRLNNAVADAEAMAKALSSVGFNVSKHLNVNEKGFKLALRDFRMRLEPGDEVVVFFAGHGVQLNNTNYLLPVDIKGENEEQIRDEAIQLQRVLDDLQDRRAKFALAVVDACRDNPFKGSGRALGGRGLAPTTAATGQMILFSAGAGQQALDRLGKDDKERNGLFTRIFVKEMVKPGVSVDRVLRNVRNEVVRLAKTIGHDQTPALYDQAVGDFFFRQ